MTSPQHLDHKKTIIHVTNTWGLKGELVGKLNSGPRATIDYDGQALGANVCINSVIL